jgi:hypothetical protein
MDTIEDVDVRDLFSRLAPPSQREEVESGWTALLPPAEALVRAIREHTPEGDSRTNAVRKVREALEQASLALSRMPAEKR